MQPAVVCSRCGVFLASPAELKLLDGRMFCLACAARPDVDYLEAFRLKYWGKRDIWAWLIGLGTLSNALLLVSHLGKGEWLLAGSSAFGLVVCICFFFGQAWARWGVVASMASALVISVANAPPGTGATVGGTFLFPSFVLISMINDTRNRLFFKLDISRGSLQKAWHLYSNNSIARAGFMLSLMSLIMPPLAVISLVLSIIGLRRVDPAALPPIGRKGQAIAGVVLSSLSLLFGAALLISYLVSQS